MKAAQKIYSRTSFVDDLSTKLEGSSKDTQTEIFDKLGITPVYDSSGKMTGYDGIIDLTKLSSEGIEGEVLQIANDFILNNRVETGNSELDNALNGLIQGMPEFINTIGKQQHDTQAYSLDVHILEAYKTAITDPEYNSLSNYQKFELKLMTIVHDISKSEGVVDENHPLVSAKYAYDILGRYSITQSTRYEIANNIMNHHWGKEYNTHSSSNEKIAVGLRTVSNYDVQKIFAKADLTAIGNQGFLDKLEGLSEDSQKGLVDTISKTKETTPLVYTTPIVKPDLVPSTEITLVDGTTKTIKSFNLQDLPEDFDMGEYGFIPGTKVKDLILGVHTANSVSDFKTFEMLASNPVAQSPQSVSIISQHDTALFKRFGVLVDLRAADVLNATHYNQNSGSAKLQDVLTTVVTGDNYNEAWREIIPNKIQDKLNISPSEYSTLAARVEDYNYVTQIKDTESFVIGDRTLTGKEVKDAILESTKELMQMSTNMVPANDGYHQTGDITELVVRHAEVYDGTYVLRFNSADGINNPYIPMYEKEALAAFLKEIPEGSTVIFAGYDGYLHSNKANTWKTSK